MGCHQAGSDFIRLKDYEALHNTCLPAQALLNERPYFKDGLARDRYRYRSRDRNR